MKKFDWINYVLCLDHYYLKLVKRLGLKKHHGRHLMYMYYLFGNSYTWKDVKTKYRMRKFERLASLTPTRIKDRNWYKNQVLKVLR